MALSSWFLLFILNGIDTIDKPRPAKTKFLLLLLSSAPIAATVSATPVNEVTNDHWICNIVFDIFPTLEIDRIHLVGLKSFVILGKKRSGED